VKAYVNRMLIYFKNEDYLEALEGINKKIKFYLIHKIDFNKIKELDYSKMFYEDYTCLEKLLRVCCCVISSKLKEKNLIMNNLKRMLYKKMSIEQFGKINKKIETLEHLIFNEKQKSLLKYLTIPVHHKISIEELKNYFEIIKENYNECEINKKIVELLQLNDIN